MMKPPDGVLGELVSRFVAERVYAPQPDEVDIWTELACGGLFSVAFVCWLPRFKTCSSHEQMDTELNSLINEIVNRANVWINIKAEQAFGSRNGSAHIEGDKTRFVKARLEAMFQEAIAGMVEKNFDPEVARSHAYFVVVSRELERLVLKNTLPLSAVRDVLTQGLSIADEMASEACRVISARQV